MILDKLLFDNISIIGKNIIKELNLDTAPSNVEEMHKFLELIKKKIELDDFEGALIGKILFSFVSSKEVRDRNTTSRTFEDIFSSLFEQTSTDKSVRTNPVTNEEISEFNKLTEDYDWSISGDLSGNKREKSDLNIGDYKISLKTLKGPCYEIDGTCSDKNSNNELNVGSFSYRSLLIGIIPSDNLARLGDRKGGLGSKRQIRKNVLNVINENNNQEKFASRLKLFLRYVYEEDVYIVLKSNFQLKFILIPNDSFVNTIVDTYKKNESEFENIFYRWENNNLRIPWKNLLKNMGTYGYNYEEININLASCLSNKTLIDFEKDISDRINNFFVKNIKDEN